MNNEALAFEVRANSGHRSVHDERVLAENHKIVDVARDPDIGCVVERSGGVAIHDEVRPTDARVPQGVQQHRLGYVHGPVPPHGQDRQHRLERGPGAHPAAFNLSNSGNSGIDRGEGKKILKLCRKRHSIKAVVDVPRPREDLGPRRLQGP